MTGEMAGLREATEQARSASAFARGYLDYLCGLLQRLDTGAIGKAAGILEEARRKGRRIYLIGNGGSAATASHMANDLSLGARAEGSGRFKAISLTDNHSVVTALANDSGYENVFSAQLEVLLEPGDVLVAISASGDSPNVVRAVEYAKSRGAATVAFAGFDGGAIARLCDIAVVARTPKGEYGPVEDAHMALDHLLMSYFKSRLSAAAASGPAGS